MLSVTAFISKMTYMTRYGPIILSRLWLNPITVQLLVTLGQFGNDSAITGNRSVFNVRTMGEFKFRRFVEDQVANKEVSKTLTYSSPSYSPNHSVSSNTTSAVSDSVTAKPVSLSYSLQTVTPSYPTKYSVQLTIKLTTQAPTASSP